MQLLEATYSDADNNNTFVTNNNGRTGDLVSYDNGSGAQSSRIDSHWDYRADILLADGSTVTRILGMVQLENGDLFINGDVLDNLEIVSITPTSIQHSGYSNWGGERDISNSSIACYALGTLIACENGLIEVQCLKVGDKVTTVDRGHQEVRWVGCRRITAVEMTTNPALKPVRISAGALGEGLPKRDLLVSQQHRMLVKSRIAERMFGSDEVLVAAKQLVTLEGIEYADDVQNIVYVHFACNQHEVVLAEGAPTESLYTGVQAMKALDQAAKAEILSIFPDLCDEPSDYTPPSARPLVKGRVANKLVARHKANKRDLFEKHTERNTQSSFKSRELMNMAT
jgi:hypothetical protein